MNNLEKALRLGIYAGMAATALGDESYAQRFRARNIDDVSDAEYLQVAVEIQERLVAAGVIRPDEDPYDEAIVELGELGLGI